MPKIISNTALCCHTKSTLQQRVSQTDHLTLRGSVVQKHIGKPVSISETELHALSNL